MCLQAAFDALGDLDFALARQQLDRAHLAHVHAHRVGGAAELGVDGGQRRLGFLHGLLVRHRRRGFGHEQILGLLHHVGLSERLFGAGDVEAKRALRGVVADVSGDAEHRARIDADRERGTLPRLRSRGRRGLSFREALDGAVRPAVEFPRVGLTAHAHLDATVRREEIDEVGLAERRSDVAALDVLFQERREQRESLHCETCTVVRQRPRCALSTRCCGAARRAV